MHLCTESTLPRVHSDTEAIIALRSHFENEDSSLLSQEHQNGRLPSLTENYVVDSTQSPKTEGSIISKNLQDSAGRNIWTKKIGGFKSWQVCFWSFNFGSAYP